MAYDAVKAAQVSAYLKQGFTEDQAFEKAGIPAADDAFYSIDGIRNSPTYGQVLKGPAATGLTEAQAARNKAAAEVANKSWADEEIKTQTAGPVATRTETTTTSTVTGGAERVTQMTPEMRAWTDQSAAAGKADEAAAQAAKEEYLRSKGLDQASPSARRAALRDAEASGTNFTSTANADALGRPPKTQYETTTIQPNESGVQKPNDGEMSNDQAAKRSAAGQTAEQQLQDNSTPNQTPESLSQEEKDKLDQTKTGELSSKVEQADDPTATNKQNAEDDTNTTPKSEESFEQEKTDTKASSVVGNKDVTGRTSDYLPPLYVSGSAPTNKLHDYTSYTYRITLFLLTKNDYNALSTSPDKFVPTFSLISSGSGFATPGSLTPTTPSGSTKNVATTQTRSGRHPDFQTDFFIDNLRLTTVVGLNAKTKASNAVDISFNITEPYGLSLLDRLLSACETSGDNNPNYISQPYLLQIDLIASPADEKLIQMKQSNNIIDTKRIAIKLLEMKIKPTGSGTTYACRAMPFNHTAFSLTTAAMPVNMSVDAGTVGEFFSSRDDLSKLFAGELKSQDERLESDLKAWLANQGTSLTQPTPPEIEAKLQALKNATFYNSKSLTAAYNTYMEDVVKKQQLTRLPPTKIAFNIPAAEIAESPLVDETAQDNNANMNDLTSSVGQAGNSQRKKTETFNFHAGTSIIEVIDQVMGKSQYLKNQIISLGKENNEKQAAANDTNGNGRAADKPQPKTLKWYKVVPTVALNEFDASRNDYSKTILYSILPYTAANTYHPNFPKTTAETAMASVVREYNYIYTGKNQDIIKLDIDFDSTYYTQLTTYRNQVARLGTDRSSDPGDILPTQFGFRANSQQTNLPHTIHVAGSNKDSNSMNTAANPTERVLADLKKSIYTSQRGDLLNIKVQIIGDPAFIKQDDIYYNPGSPSEYLKFSQSRTNNSAAPITASGQILFDAQQVYVRVNFKNAVDIDDKIGIVNKQHTLTNGRTTDGTFSGVYRVLQVVSEFSRGEFTQTLDLIRMPDTLTEIATTVAQTTQTGASSDTQSAKQSEQSDQSKRAVIAGNPAGVAPAVSPKLLIAAEQPAVSSPVINPGTGNPIEIPNAYQAAPQNANNAQDIAPQTTAGWTFQDAFSQARKDFGNRPGGVFEWRGKLYQTNYQNEPFLTNPTPVYPGANQ